MFLFDGRKIRLTRGDTGCIGFFMDTELTDADRAMISVSRARGGAPLLTLITMPEDNGRNLRFVFTREDTEALVPGEYIWDVRVVLNAVEDDDGRITDGDEVITPWGPQQLTVERSVGRIE